MNQQSRLPRRRGTTTPVSAGLVGVAAAGSAVAHVVAAASGPAGVMAWWMAAMGAACLSCAAPMAGFPARTFCAGQAATRAAGHLLAMSAAMILIHLVLLLGPGSGHHGHVQGASTPDHQPAMLILIGVELLCLMAASAALRMTRTATPHPN
ncbi:hypothetical protein J3A64_003101 [Pseudarthrobacter sp. PvP004]|uniref:Uncharacterized protein n=1 Tax=Paenarthrobacter aurescens (strain TC1) TaxID=290340 RepID=A1R2C4_PAEAT|nr:MULTISPECIES: hypothetical protein [Micrococcaceae]ABM09447.1 hypothetical protein AAur_0580 [Paenarthrobacter aurescens TC1]MBP2267637.1 hypothetical protein [Pseudarthrobacter sp. PvP004]